MKTWRLRFASLKTPDDIFDLIVSGRKTIETRPAKAPGSNRNYSNILPGDKLLFCSMASSREILKTVTFVHPYKSVSEMLKKENPIKILPTINSKEELLAVYEEAKAKWGEKYKFEIENYGIVAIGFK